MITKKKPENQEKRYENAKKGKFKHSQHCCPQHKITAEKSIYLKNSQPTHKTIDNNTQANQYICLKNATIAIAFIYSLHFGMHNMILHNLFISIHILYTFFSLAAAVVVHIFCWN